MDVVAQAVARAVEEADVDALLQAGLIAERLEIFLHHRVDLGAGHARADGLDRAALGLEHREHHLALLRAGLPLEVGAGHVAVVVRRDVAGIDIADDELVGADRAGAGAMAVHRLVAGGDDQADVAEPALTEDRNLRLLLEDFRRERLTLPLQHAFLVRLGLREDLLDRLETGDRGDIARADAGEFGLRLHLTFREELGRAAFVLLGADGVELEAEFAETLEEPYREIGRHAEALDATFEGGEDDRVGHARLRVGLAEVADDRREVEHLVEGGFILRAPDFHAREQADATAADREGRERVRSVEAAEPTQIGVLGRSRHHQDVADGGSGGAGHGRRMTEVGSP